ncbi:hypothetical protein F511_17123 [Dorcoceras hygrometricum]|uniref:Dystroglycan-like n=1 Tax=Dorcoceras hygrometricum TaxID=472368 RepID=A0A2Z7CUR6_9LAMI|nr:hypothetical protein F511_17123 [Dorcoceras hygrometricum]
MVQMFRAFESTGLRGFLGCPSVLYEQELEQFFDTALVQDNDITCVISGKYVAISEDRFAGVFNMPTDGLIDLSEVPNHLVLQARTMFSKYEKPVMYSCKKRLLTFEFRLLNDILAKSITVKAGSFDSVTHERFLMMTAIHFGVKINWSKILVEVLKEMAYRTIKIAKGFAAQICVLLKGDPAVSLGEAKTFPPLKFLSEKTVNIDARGESEEPHEDKVVIVKRKSIADLASVKEIAAKEKQMLIWAETNSLETVVKRRVYIIAKYKEMLLRKFLESHRRSDLQLPDSGVNFSSPHDYFESRMHFDSADIPLGDATADDQSSMPPATDFIEDFAQLLLTEIRSLEKKLTEMLEQQDKFYGGLFKTVLQEIKIQKTALSFELLEFKRAVGAQNALLIFDVTDIRSHTKEIQSLKTDFMLGIRIRPPARQRKNRKQMPGDDQYEKFNNKLRHS